jgi:hypothetical protein
MKRCFLRSFVSILGLSGFGGGEENFLLDFPYVSDKCKSVHLGQSEGSTQIECIIFIIIISGVGLCPLGTAAASGLLYKPQMIDEGDCGAISGMKIDRGNRSTQR